MVCYTHKNRKGGRVIPKKTESLSANRLLNIILKSLDDNQAGDVISVDLHEKSDIADFMVVASGRSSRHVGSLGTKLREDLAKHGLKNVHMEGFPNCDWVLVDAGDVMIHLFKPEVREYYNLEKMWGVSFADQQAEKAKPRRKPSSNLFALQPA